MQINNSGEDHDSLVLSLTGYDKVFADNDQDQQYETSRNLVAIEVNKKPPAVQKKKQTKKFLRMREQPLPYIENCDESEMIRKKLVEEFKRKLNIQSNRIKLRKY